MGFNKNAIDAELVAQMVSEDINSFNELYLRYWKTLYTTAVKVLRNSDEAEDVVQDVFLSFWQRRREIVIASTVKAYLLTSIRYRAIKHIEKNITRRDYLEILTNTADQVAPADAETNMALKALQDAIARALSKMPPKMLHVYKLSREENLSYKEIAAELGISTETVKKHIKFALQYIREEMVASKISVTAVLMSILFGK